MVSDLSGQQKINIIGQRLSERFGRPPTSYELLSFIMGDDKTRSHIWNFGLKDGEVIPEEE